MQGQRVLVTTENAKAYAIDKLSGAIRWSRDFGTPFSANDIGCGDLTPNLGSTSTPVVDPVTQTEYLTTKVVEAGQAKWYLHAVSVADGTERTGWPVEIKGAPESTPGLPFIARTAMQRPGLLLMNGVVYAAFASHCDIGPYRGYIVGVDTAAHNITTMWTSEYGVGTDEASAAGIWQGGGGLMSDGPGRMIFSTGNGIAPPVGPGHSPVPTTLSEAVVRADVGVDGILRTQDVFSPWDAPTLDLYDADLGSGGPVGLPDSFGTPSHPHLAVQTGKDGRVYLLDRDDLGGRGQGAGGGDKVVDIAGPFGGQWGHQAVYGGEGGWVYQVEANGPLRALAGGVTAGGTPTLTSTGTSTGSFGYTSGSPIVTSDGTTAGSALVWVEYSTGSTGTGGQLRAYRAIPSGGVLTQAFSAAVGAVSKFAVPVADGGRVYVGTRDGKLIGFGRPAAPALQTSSTDLGNVAVGGTPASGSTTITATRDVQITASSVTGPFAATPTLPATLHAGDVLTIPLTFSPTRPGDASGQLSLTTDAGTVAMDLHGYGTSPVLTGTPNPVNYGQLALGYGAKTLAVTVSNTSTVARTITAVTAPAAPFSAASLPAVGLVVASKASISVPITYLPTAAASDAGSLIITSSQDGLAGTSTLTVPLTGSAVSGSPHLTISPATLEFGSVGAGGAKTLSFDVRNTGNVPVTITKAKAPTGAFFSATPLSEGLTLPPDAVIHQQVTFSPTATGAIAATYSITGDDGQGAQIVQLHGTGINALPVVRDWVLNGVAVKSKKGVLLTAADQYGSAGSAVSPTVVKSDGLAASFHLRVGGGSDADGLTFALLDGSLGTDALGAQGGGLRYSGLDGPVIAFDTYQNCTDPSTNFVGIARSATGDCFDWLATNTSIGDLRTGTHSVSVRVRGQRITVRVDGATVFNQVTTMPAMVRPAFTAGTGGLTDDHEVYGTKVTYKP